jgi:CheY-like chemotaxis protein
MSAHNFLQRTRYDHNAAQHARANTHHRRPTPSTHPRSAKRPTLLLVAELEVSSHLVKLLGTLGYAVHAVTETVAAQAILAVVPIDLVLLHCPPEMSFGGWQTYTQLRQCTTKPVMMIANIRAEHFTANAAANGSEAIDADLVNYLNSVDLLCRTLIL